MLAECPGDCMTSELPASGGTGTLTVSGFSSSACSWRTYDSGSAFSFSTATGSGDATITFRPRHFPLVRHGQSLSGFHYGRDNHIRQQYCWCLR